MAKSTAAARGMKNLRQRRREAGLVEARYWLTPKQKQEVDKLINRMNITANLEKSNDEN